MLNFTTAISVQAYEFDRYNHLENTISPEVEEEAPTEDGDLEAVDKTKDEIELEDFNGTFVDTVIYIIGGLSGMMMLVQLTAFTVCKLYPSFNRYVAKLSKIGITGYEDGWIAPTLKILLLGILAYLCISGTMKYIVAYILGWFTNFVHFE